MKVTLYTNAEQRITSVDGSGIRERWLYGLRLLRDPEAMSKNGGGLKHGVADQLIAAATKRRLNLSAREIRYRIQAARAYPTEAQIGNAIAVFGSWFALIQAAFPPLERPEDEPDADHRTDSEKRHARAQQMLDAVGEQYALFPLEEMEPTETTLKELVVYAEDQASITARFAERDAARAEYLTALREAVDDDLETTWETAHRAAFGDDDNPR
jgi:hypothetical protein